MRMLFQQLHSTPEAPVYCACDSGCATDEEMSHSLTLLVTPCCQGQLHYAVKLPTLSK